MAQAGASWRPAEAPPPSPSGAPDPSPNPAPWQDYQTVFTNAKAGMEGVDKEKVQRIVYEMSKDSAHFRNEQRKQAATAARIERLRERSAGLGPAELAAAGRSIDERVAALEAGRDLSRLWLHADMDCFYAAVHEAERPELKTQPMAVGGIGMISTANYVARKYGVRSAMPGFIAKKLCPQLVFVPLDFAKYTAAAEGVRAVFRQLDPDFESGGLDEAYLDVTDFCAAHGMTPEEAAAELRRRVRESCGGLTCSCGVAPNKTLAKICSDINKPDGHYVLPSSREAVMRFVDTLPTRKVPCIGKVTEQVLKGALGIATCGQLLGPQRARLGLLFSEAALGFFLEAGLGLGATRHAPKTDRAVEPGRKGISCERTFRAMRAPGEQEALAGQLVESLAADMASEEIEGRNLTLKLKLTNFEVRTRSVTLPRHVRAAPDMLPPVLRLLRAEQPLELRLMGVRMAGLRKVHAASRSPLARLLGLRPQGPGSAPPAAGAGTGAGPTTTPDPGDSATGAAVNGGFAPASSSAAAAGRAISAGGAGGGGRPSSRVAGAHRTTEPGSSPPPLASRTASRGAQGRNEDKTSGHSSRALRLADGSFAVPPGLTAGGAAGGGSKAEPSSVPGTPRGVHAYGADEPFAHDEDNEDDDLEEHLGMPYEVYDGGGGASDDDEDCVMLEDGEPLLPPWEGPGGGAADTAASGDALCGLLPCDETGPAPPKRARLGPACAAAGGGAPGTAGHGHSLPPPPPLCQQAAAQSGSVAAAASETPAPDPAAAAGGPPNGFAAVACASNGHWACLLCTFKGNRRQMLRCLACDSLRGSTLPAPPPPPLPSTGEPTVGSGPNEGADAGGSRPAAASRGPHRGQDPRNSAAAAATAGPSPASATTVTTATTWTCRICTYSGNRRQLLRCEACDNLRGSTAPPPPAPPPLQPQQQQRPQAAAEGGTRGGSSAGAMGSSRATKAPKAQRSGGAKAAAAGAPAAGPLERLWASRSGGQTGTAAAPAETGAPAGAVPVRTSLAGWHSGGSRPAARGLEGHTARTAGARTGEPAAAALRVKGAGEGLVSSGGAGGDRRCPECGAQVAPGPAWLEHTDWHLALSLSRGAAA
ncbi:hypothetical protein HYH03_013465 [Edaphochlamys debaryana]|uniref:DNA polymerase kappa n=1 Tax=Edaphochlamys debaryana TaxID=47281 RepID=A0A835XS02_9CHLO|nr:hypothetical protein HYH03_013465 [Edaphochlamys debaryana]|eukprot:KAG2487883.1 hypothetical protein HYH03_013465 [Edaphochlamys debaryana]